MVTTDEERALGYGERHKLIPGMTWRRMPGGAVEIETWSVQGQRLGSTVIAADKFVDGVAAVSDGWDQLATHNRRLRRSELARIHDGRE